MASETDAGVVYTRDWDKYMRRPSVYDQIRFVGAFTV